MLNNENSLGCVDQIKVHILIENNSGNMANFLAQHGLSIILDVTSGNIRKRILFDTGQMAMPVLHNMDILGIRPESIDMIVLSHCHQDHTSGLIDILNKIGREIPIISHPSIFRKIYKVNPFFDYKGMINENQQEEIIKNGGQLILIKDPLQLMKGVITSGEIKRNNDLEKEPTGYICINDGIQNPDMMNDELALIVNVRDKGLLIISGCSHTGIINIIDTAAEITNINKLYGLVGGLHFIDKSAERIEKTVFELLQRNPSIIAPGHCTGLTGINIISNCFKDKCHILHSGKVLCL